MTPISNSQFRRARALYKRAKEALDILSEERLNLGVETRDALNESRSALESFDYHLLQQPAKPA